MKHIKYEQLNKIQKKVLLEAELAMKKSYNPYSNFFVGAAILTPNNKIITGTNIENASYSATICAERVAIAKANSEGIRELEKIAIIAKGKDFNTKYVTSPCGICRQTIYEFSELKNINTEIILSTTTKDKIILTNIYELFPLGTAHKYLK